MTDVPIDPTLSEGSHESPDSGLLLKSTPRDIPSELSSKVVGWLAGWVIVGLIAGGIFLWIGWSNHDDFIDSRAMLYQGEIAEAQVAMTSDDEDTWAVANVAFQGKLAKNVPIEISEAEVSEVSTNTSKGRYTMLQVVFWPEDFQVTSAGTLQNEEEFVSVEWLREQSPTASFGWAYYAAAACMLLFGWIGLRGMFKRKGRYERGVEIWGEPEEVTFNSESSTYNARVSYEIKGKSKRSKISWSQASPPLTESMTGRVLGLVDPRRPGAFHVLAEPEVNALSR